ncbi:reprolysin-like metallopeptidase [Lysobacter sp. HA35]
MRKLLPLVALAATLAGCVGSDHPSSSSASAPTKRATAMQPSRMAATGLAAIRARLVHGDRYASLPDRGELLAYTAGAADFRMQAYTWKQVHLSEAHALDAIGGTMMIPSPDGHLIRLRYDHHIEHQNGDWTWVGRPAGAKPGTEALITFGEKAVFGSIPDGVGPPLRIMQANGVSWMVKTDPAALASLPAANPTGTDAIPVPPAASRPSADATSPTPAAAPTSAAAASVASTTVDLVLGYTTGFANRLGGQSQANTRLNNIVDFANQGYQNSGIDGRVRLVNTVQVDYVDNTDNDQALYDLTGYDCSGTGACVRRTVPASLQPLRSARDQYGADVVSLVRIFDNDTNKSCGVGWILGGGQKPITSADEAWAMSIVSDSNGRDPNSSFPSGGYVCRDETLAHEMGHNMGAQHDVATAKGDNGVLDANEYGRFAYSFGYKSDANGGNFYTIMAYGEKLQQDYRLFSNPRITACGGRPCGTSQADNAQTLSQTMPMLASFRATVIPTASAQPPRLVAIGKLGSSGWTEAHVLDGTSSYTQFTSHIATAIGLTGADYAWQFQLGDYNGDGVKDIYAFGREGASGTTEIHVLNGADNFQSFLLHSGSALRNTGRDNSWVFRLGDWNGDGRLDVFAIAKNGSSGATEIHVLDGAHQFQSFLLHVATALGSTGSDASWDFQVTDFNRDGVLDLMLISKRGASGTTEVHVLSGGTMFQAFLLQTATALHTTGVTSQWVFKLGDYNGDGVLDLYAVNRIGSSGMTEVHVLDGVSRFTTFSGHIGTALRQTGADDAWQFELL